MKKSSENIEIIMSRDFNGSFRPKGHFETLVRNKLESDGFIQSGKKRNKAKKDFAQISPSFGFFNQDVKKSRTLDIHMFTNYLSESTSQSIKTSVYDIFENPGIIDTPNADAVRFNHPKIEECLKLYIDIIPADCLILKSNLIDEIGVPKPIRVFSLMMLDPVELKATYLIILIDPFHLVIPSEFEGRAKDVVEREIYEFNKNNQLCMNDYYNRTRCF